MVGTPGSILRRLGAATANAIALPSRKCRPMPTLRPMGNSLNVILKQRQHRLGPAANGTLVMSIPLVCLKALDQQAIDGTHARGAVVELPAGVGARVGDELFQRTRRDGRIENSTSGTSATWAIGFRAVSGSNVIFSRNWLMTKVWLRRNQDFVAVGLTPLTSCVPMLPAAPGFASITSFWP